MKKRLVLTAIVCIALLPCWARAAEEQAPPKSTAELKNDTDKVSYVIGADFGTKLQQAKIEINKDILLIALKDALDGKTLALTDEEMREAMMNLEKRMMAKRQEEDQQAGGKNLAEGKAFLEANATKEGVKVLPSGLQYKVITEGSGSIPTTADTVKTNYRGTLIDGTEFDSSYNRGEPATFPVTGVIKGWTEALQLMKVGSKWQLFVPADLAYGSMARGGKITPNSTLIFEIELLDIEKPSSDSAIIK